MKRYFVFAAILADALFALSLGLNAWQTVTVFVAVAAAVVLAVFGLIERSEIKAERRRSQRLAGWIQDHYEGTPFHPYEGDEGER